MKAFLTLGLIFLVAVNYGFAQTYPDTIYNNGYVFRKTLENDMDGTEPFWALASWTFATNACEFTPGMGDFQSGNLDLQIVKKDSSDMGLHHDKPYWGAEYFSQQEYQYGRFVSRMKPNTPSGVVTSFFLTHIDWTNNFTVAVEWYEIDIEFAGTNDDVQFTCHWIEDGQKLFRTVTVPVPYDITTEAHDWIIEWTPTYVSYYVDTTWLYTFDDSLLMAELAHPQSIRMNCWVSESESWVGPFSESDLPVVSTYEHIVYYEMVQQPDPPSSIATVSTDQAPNLFPNPVGNVLNITPATWGNASFEVVDLLGKQVLGGTFKQSSVDLSALPKGTYLLIATNAIGERWVEKVVKD